MIQKSRPYLVHLNLRGCLKLTSNSFVTVAGCHNIQDLNLSNCINLTVIIYDNNTLKVSFLARDREREFFLV